MSQVEHKFKPDGKYGTWVLINDLVTDDVLKIVVEKLRKNMRKTFVKLNSIDALDRVLIFHKPQSPETLDCAVSGWLYDTSDKTDQEKIDWYYGMIKQEYAKVEENNGR